jgi:hypothetical protein
MSIEGNINAADSHQFVNLCSDKSFFPVPLDQLPILGCPMRAAGAGQKNRFDDIGLPLGILADQKNQIGRKGELQMIKIPIISEGQFPEMQSETLPLLPDKKASDRFHFHQVSGIDFLSFSFFRLSVYLHQAFCNHVIDRPAGLGGVRQFQKLVQLDKFRMDFNILHSILHPLIENTAYNSFAAKTTDASAWLLNQPTKSQHFHGKNNTFVFLASPGQPA